MQVVVMAAVLAVVGAGQRCVSSCRPTSVVVQVEACHRKEYISSTRCEGQCYNEDPLYISKGTNFRQHICTGNWTHEIRHIDGCEENIIVPVAIECNCDLCNFKDTYCNHFTDTLAVLPSNCPPHL